ncbi:methionyl-tRNA synthetase [Tritrichomonas musculus]|uniref:methionine--tRNA ligase n=1 Tax=Tritrichomonas musculus TaxID=1915356 RepID=A0ABR2I739_9EUKA
MELLYISQTSQQIILNSVLPLLKEQPKVTEVSILQRAAVGKKFEFQIWPILKVDDNTAYFGLHAIVKYLFTGTPYLTPANSSETESVMTLSDALYSSAVPIVAHNQSVLIKDELLKSSQNQLKHLLQKVAKYQTEKPTLASAYLNGVLNVLAALEIDVSPCKASPASNIGLFEEAISFAHDNLSLPERYKMSAPPEKKMYFSTPIYYVNGVPHIGHVFTTTLVESLSNWYKLRGIPIIYSSGTDEHGLKVQTTAQENNSTPQAWCDKTSGAFREAFKDFDLAPDDFIRTSEERHLKVATKFWEILAEKGYIYKGKYEGWYSKREESFIPENQIEEQVINGKTVKVNKEDGAELVWSSEDNYMFKLSAMKEKLLNWLDSNPNCITPRCYWNHVRSSVLGDLRDISVSRLKKTVSWGVPVPGDPDHTMYVWIDALTNYLTVSGWYDNNMGIWPCDLHTVGKDIVKFHGIYWPAFLMAAGVPVYKRLLVHGWWTMDNEKMSKSLGNTLDPIKLRDFWGLEPVKYFLLRECTLTSDSDYSVSAMLNRLNNDLADVLGNLVMRIISPKINPEMTIPQIGERTEADNKLIESVETLPGTVDHHVAFGRTKVALQEIWEVLHELNKYLTDQAPWAIKDNQARKNTVLYILCESLRIITICFHCFIPRTADKILAGLGTSKTDGDNVSRFKFGLLKPGTKITEVPVLFTKKKIDE